MIPQLVFSNDTNILQIIQKTLASRQNIKQTQSYFWKTLSQKNNHEPIFVIGMNDLTKQIMVIYFLVVQYKFVWDLGKALHMEEIYLHRQIRLEDINNFDNDLKSLLLDYKLVYLRVNRFRLIKPLINGFKEIKRNFMSVGIQDFEQTLNSELFQQVKVQFSDMEFRYFKEGDSQLSFFDLLNNIYQKSYINVEGSNKQLQIMNNSNTKHIHIIGRNKQKNQIQAFGSLIIFDSLDGKKAMMVNVVTSKKVRGKGYGKVIARLLKNEAWKNKCLSIGLSCQQKYIKYYESLNFKFVKFLRLLEQFDFQDQNVNQEDLWQ